MRASPQLGQGRPFHRQPHPLAFAMWDFSWLERRWTGAGYEDWDRALDELAERGYNALRIDAYPHLVANGLERATLRPVWTVHEWGSPGVIDVRPMPALAEFIARCGERKIQVGLSTWFRQDELDTRRRIDSPEGHAEVWLETIAQLRTAGIMEHVCYVDLCNEFPGEHWAPFFDNSPDSSWNGMTAKAVAWMEAAVRAFRAQEPTLPTTVSLVGFDAADPERWRFMDFLEPHIWMTQSSDFLERIGGNYNNFDFTGYEAIAAKAVETFRGRQSHWETALRSRIDAWAAVARACRRPLVTTECWAIVNYRDWPGLDWGWVKELCELGVDAALQTECWAGVATSNFCGPQFAGMWRDVAWHQRLTEKIRRARVGTF